MTLDVDPVVAVPVVPVQDVVFTTSSGNEEIEIAVPVIVSPGGCVRWLDICGNFSCRNPYKTTITAVLVQPICMGFVEVVPGNKKIEITVVVVIAQWPLTQYPESLTMS